MLKVFIIDDDMPSIKIIEYFLSDYQDVAIEGRFTNPLEALKQLEEAEPELVFLDINMSQLCGMEVAKKILNRSPGTLIVFTTAYDNFAVDAFEVNASDYLVKPIMKARFDKAMERILSSEIKPEPENKLYISCFGKFQVYRQNEEPIRWRTEKSKELAALLISNSGQTMTRDEIIELIWPDTELDRAIHYLHNSIYYMRKSLENYHVRRTAVKICGSYSVIIDDTVENNLDKFTQLYAKPEKDLQALEDLSTILSRDFMEGEDWGWTIGPRESYAKKNIEIAMKLSKSYFLHREYGKAAEVLQKAYQKSPYDETLTVMLIKLYIATGQKIKAVKHYGDYSALIKNELGISPGKYLRELIAAGTTKPPKRTN